MERLREKKSDPMDSGVADCFHCSDILRSGYGGRGERYDFLWYKRNAAYKRKDLYCAKFL